MKFNLEKTLEILGNTPGTLHELLFSLSSKWVNENEGGETWSPYEVVAHMTYLEETNWITRINIIVENKNNGKFESIDRVGFREMYKFKSLNELLKIFEQTRFENLKILEETLKDEKLLDKTGIHPDFGLVTLRQLISTWMVHDLSHIGQITRVLAKQYKDEVGPWIAFLRILK